VWPTLVLFCFPDTSRSCHKLRLPGLVFVQATIARGGWRSPELAAYTMPSFFERNRGRTPCERVILQQEESGFCQMPPGLTGSIDRTPTSLLWSLCARQSSRVGGVHRPSGATPVLTVLLRITGLFVAQSRRRAGWQTLRQVRQNDARLPPVPGVHEPGAAL
jgi:heme A synthase